MNIETYGYGKKRKTYDPDYEHVESAKFREYERLEGAGYEDEVRPKCLSNYDVTKPQWGGGDVCETKCMKPSIKPVFSCNIRVLFMDSKNISMPIGP